MSEGLHPRVWSAVVLLGLIAALAAPLPVLAGTSPAGKWTGKMKTPDGEEVDILLDVAQEGSVWTGSLESTATGTTSVTGLKVTDTRISFTFKPEGAPYPAHFSGSYIAGDDRISGTFSLRGNSRFVKFQRVPGSETVAVVAGEEPVAPARIRHEYRFSATARLSYWAALHVVEDNNYKINDLTVDDWSYDGALTFYLLDGFALYFRGWHGSQKTTSDQTKLDQYNDIGLVSQSTWKLDGWEFGMTGYLGNAIMKNSKFNPYVTAAGGQVDWQLTHLGRGSDVLILDEYPLEGKATSIAAGLGTEYAISKRLSLDFEWVWRYFLTQDTDKWPDSEDTWSNTHAWAFSFGLTYGFW